MQKRVDSEFKFMFSTGLWNKICDFIKDSIQKMKNGLIRLFDYATGTKKKKYSLVAVCLIIVVVVIGFTVSLWLTSDNTGTR